MADMVNNPSHYNREGAMETIEEMILLFGIEETKSFCKLNAWKYRARALYKNKEEDMQKSDWYLKKYKQLSQNHTDVANMSLNDNSFYFKNNFYFKQIKTNNE